MEFIYDLLKSNRKIIYKGGANFHVFFSYCNPLKYIEKKYNENIIICYCQVQSSPHEDIFLIINIILLEYICLKSILFE